ncbi:Hypothetical predicted protein, partial [Olea europaea subsp. europaea]
MEVVAAALNSLLGEPCRLLVRSIYSRIGNFLKRRRNFIDLQKNIESLVEVNALPSGDGRRL